MEKNRARTNWAQAGGPRWRVLLGRRDGTTTNVQSANNLPSPFDSLAKLQEKFRNVNLDNTDLVALQGNINMLSKYIICTPSIPNYKSLLLFWYIYFAMHLDMITCLDT